MDWKQELAELIDRAEREGLWLWCRYQDLWFSPESLRQNNAEGRFVWGPTNWELRDPQERVEEAQRRVNAAHAQYERVKAEHV